MPPGGAVPADVRELLVFVASSSDVSQEREAVHRAAAGAHEIMGSDAGFRLQVVGWEQVQPEYGRPQALINPHVDECDIFIGIMNRRWGSPTGTHSSGFEEEFERALSRRSNSEAPVIGMYFKRVPDDVLADPGQELSKVLAFKRRLQSEKTILYREFDSAGDLEADLTKFFARHLVGDLKSVMPRAPQNSPPNLPAVIEDPAEDLDQARTQVGDVLSAWVELVGGAEVRRPLDADRLLLFAMSINRDYPRLPVHVANRLYQKREALALTAAEFNKWLGSFAADVASSGVTGWGRVIPGWYFAAHHDGAGIAALGDDLAHFVLSEESVVANGAFILLSQLRLRPHKLWGTPSATTTNSEGIEVVAADRGSSPVDFWMQACRDREIPDSALAYIAEVAQETDLPLLDAIRAGLDDARGSNSIWAIQQYLAGSVNALVEVAASKYRIPTWIEKRIRASISSAEVESLEQLLNARHSNVSLFAAVLAELVRRDALSQTALHRALGVKEKDHQAVVLSNIRAMEPKWIKEALSGFDKKQIDDDLDFCFEALVQDVDSLRARTSVLISGVEAWEALAWKLGHEMAEEARQLLDTDAAMLDGALAGLSGASEGKSLVEYLKGRARRAAITVLADLPAAKRTSEDAERIRKELERGYWFTKGPAAMALARVGGPRDAQILLEASSDVYLGEDRQAVLKQVARLGGVEVARELARHEETTSARAGAEVLVEMPEVQDSELVDLLYSEHDPVRIIALAALRKRWSIERLRQLMLDYPDGPEGTYYYNVVVELDRLLYAPPQVAGLPCVPSLA
ncbi:DUF4062 domain-containing protein [Micromonospora sp. NPDC047738]|uniref:DUF4062 domain-containing protein n=1 Tax=Micromonospora sp. NPDC047738 TaxID=3155741 RepID=UPI0033D5FC48